MVRCSTDNDASLRDRAHELCDRRQEERTMGIQNRPGPCVIAACALAAFALHAGNTSAQGSNCLLDIGAVVVNGSIQIATSCELTGTDVKGNVILFAGGSLIARNVHIRGRLEGSRANFVDMARSRVDGNVRLEELVGDVSTLELTDFRRDVLLTGNRSHLEILNNEIEGDLVATGNTGGLMLAGNSIGEDLACTGNTPTPLGIGNRVDGDREGQCESLQAEVPPPTPPPTAIPSPPSMPAPPPTEPLEKNLVDGGSGAMGWLAVLLLSLPVWRRFARR